jgi:hypothetical protein
VSCDSWEKCFAFLNFCFSFKWLVWVVYGPNTQIFV